MNAPNGDSSSRAGWHQLLAHPTRLAIVNALRERPREIAELADAAGVHPNTVRSHLDRLHRAGVLATESVRRGTRGRPTKQYRLLDSLETGPPSSGGSPGDTPRLLMRTIVSLSQRAPGGSATAVATEEGFRMGQELGQRLAPADAQTGDGDGSWVVSLLDHLSFAPRVRHENEHLEVDLLQCPFWDDEAAEEGGDVVCSFHLGILRGAADSAGEDPEAVELTPFAQPGCCRVTLAPSNDVPQAEPHGR